jgi:aryl-alcohol dehydrogenase-like predicted oxidoreductase
MNLRSAPLALGTAGLGGVWGAVNPADSIQALLMALESGIEVFDTAPAYGRAEEFLGRALEQWKGSLPFISTKVGKLPATGPSGSVDFSPPAMRHSVRQSLDRLNVNFVDLLLLHEPQLVPPADRPGVIETLLELKAQGLARHLGLGGGYAWGWSGFLDSASFDVVMIHNRLDACCFDALPEDVSQVRRNRAALYGASLLHNGLLGDRFHEYAMHKPTWMDEVYVRRARRLRSLAAEHGLSLSSLAHRFAFSIAEYDRLVLGASNSVQLHSALADWSQGPLERTLFDAVCRIATAG